MVSCEQAKVICNKNQYREASLVEQIQLMGHNLFCKACFRFARKNTRFTRMIHRADLHSLTPAEKKRMKQHLQDLGNS